MGWGEPHRSMNGGSGTTGEIEAANKALDEIGVKPGPLALRAIELAKKVKSKKRWRY